MSQITDPIMLDRTGERIADALENMSARPKRRIASLTDTPLVSGGIVEAIGIPAYVNDVSEYSAYGITEKGWYVFCRVWSDEIEITGETSVDGATGYIAEIGSDHIDMAIRFEVASVSKKVIITWALDVTETIVFKATDLAVRNLDYRSTFYIYDIARFASWTYSLATDNTFASGKNYYTLNDAEEYVLAEVTAGNPAIYYEQVISYALTTDETFVDGKTYYTESGGEYTEATVTTGETVPADTYYEQSISYIRTEDAAFIDGKTYYTTSDGTAYSAAEVNVGDPIISYYVHSKLSFAGMVRNVTYKFDEIADCPIEIVLPEVPDDGYGCWYEIQMQYNGSYSVTLLPTDTTVKIGTATTQSQTAGVNIIDLQYTEINDVKMWTLLNTHSNIPAETTT